jgi:hypothetical protein
MKPVAGDWDQGGLTTIGLYDPTTSIFYLRDSNTAGYANLAFQYGPANSGWVPLVGDWTGNTYALPAPGATVTADAAPLAAVALVNATPLSNVPSQPSVTETPALTPTVQSTATASNQQLQTVDPRALDRIDLPTVADNVVGPQCLDVMAGNLVGGTLGSSALHTDAVLASYPSLSVV